MSKLSEINFDIVEWYDKSCYILVNTGSTKELILEYNEVDNQEIYKVFKSIIFDEKVEENIVKSLIENDWVEFDHNGNHVLSKKSCVIFKDMILEADGFYKACKICSFLVYKDDMHEYCRDILEEKTHL